MPNQPHSPSAGTDRRSRILTPLLTRYRSALRRQAARHVRCPADAEDALQEACLQFLGHYDGPAGIDALRWMLVVTKRCAWALGQRSARREVLAELNLTEGVQVEGAAIVTGVTESPGPYEHCERHEHDAELLAELDALKPDERASLVLLGAGYSYREIGTRRTWTQTKVNRVIAEGRTSLPSYRRT